jgi:hypothetical protein
MEEVSLSSALMISVDASESESFDEDQTPQEPRRPGRLRRLESESAGSEECKIHSSPQESAKERRLAILRTLLQERRDRERSTTQIQNTGEDRMKEERTGPEPTEIAREPTPRPGTSATRSRRELRSISDEDSTKKSEPEETPLISSPRASRSLSPSESSDNIVSPSLSLIDSVAEHTFDLMKGLHGDRPPASVRTFDPERVNAACNCAKQIYSLMRLKLDAIKIQQQLNKEKK